MKRTALLSLFFIVALIAALTLASPQPAVNAAARHTHLATLTQTVQSQGSIAVIVLLDGPFQPESSLLSSAAVAEQHAALVQVQTGVLSRLAGGYDPASLKPYTFIPAMALRVDAAGLAALAADPAVLNIQEDLPVAADLLESVPLIGAPTVWASGFSGQGQTVAILDTGVDKNHPFLAGRVVSEACYSTTNAGFGSTSVCPGGVASSIAAGSALPYAGVCPIGKCDHGTHVAGIAAGRDPGGANAIGFSGVAKDANIIAIQVFSKFPGSYVACGGVNCALSYTSDQILGLQRVYDLRANYAIAAVNMSLGGGQYSSAQQALCDSDTAATKAAIDTLRGVGIATVISSGNNGFKDAMGSPACISSAVSVGSVTDGTFSDTQTSTPDVVATYSNATTYLKLLAPGSTIYSSIPGGGYVNLTGTSMAAPHVAGAWAVLKSKFPNGTVTQVLNTLVATGKPIRDWRGNNLTKPRIRLDQAVAGAYSITGKITTNGTTGIAGVTVSTNNGLITTTSDAGGNYTLSGLLADSYTITPSKAEYTFSAVSLPVTVGPNATGINFLGTPVTYTISGKVALSGGFAVAGATLSDGAGHTTTSDALGNYTLSGLPAGSYTITPSKALYSAFTPSNRVVTVGPSKIAMDFVGTTLLYSVSGKVTSNGTTAIAGVMIVDNLGRSATTDAGGNYTLSGLPAGSYTLYPIKTGLLFTPVSQVLSLAANQTNINYTGAAGAKLTFLPNLQK